MPVDNSPENAQIRGFFNSHNGAIDSLILGFESQLRDLVDRAKVRTLAKLQMRLSLTDGVIDQTPANQRVMRSIDILFKQELDALKYNELVTAFVGQFGKQFRYFGELLDLVAPGATVDFTPADKAWFASQQLSAADSIKAAVDIVGAAAQQRSLFSVGGFKVADLAEVLSVRLGKVLPEATRIADTAITVFYRSIAERGFNQIGADLPQIQIRYKYWGPDDKLTRPFCRRLVESNRTYSREDIDAMSNGSLPNVFLTCGGFRCRHIWALASQSVRPDLRVPDPRAAV